MGGRQHGVAILGAFDPLWSNYGTKRTPKRGHLGVPRDVGVRGRHAAVSTSAPDVTRSASGRGQNEVLFGSFGVLKLGSFWGPIWGPKSGSFWGHFGSISGSQGRSQDLGVDLGISGWFWGHFGDIRGHYGTRVAGGPNTPFINNT